MTCLALAFGKAINYGRQGMRTFAFGIALSAIPPHGNIWIVHTLVVLVYRTLQLVFPQYSVKALN